MAPTDRATDSDKAWFRERDVVADLVMVAGLVCVAWRRPCRCVVTRVEAVNG